MYKFTIASYESVTLNQYLEFCTQDKVKLIALNVKIAMPYLILF